MEDSAPGKIGGEVKHHEISQGQTQKQAQEETPLERSDGFFLLSGFFYEVFFW
jgi:hypothetical protein